MPVRKPARNRLEEARYWAENAIKLQLQPVVHQPFVDASRRYAAMLRSVKGKKLWEKRFG